MGIQDSFVTQIILGAVNFGCTFVGMYVLERVRVGCQVCGESTPLTSISVRSPYSVDRWRCMASRLAVCVCRGRNGTRPHSAREYRHWKAHDRVCVFIHFRICLDVGTRNLDFDWRDFPNSNASETGRVGHRQQLGESSRSNFWAWLELTWVVRHRSGTS